MPRLTLDEWEKARAMREAGSSLTEVAQQFGIDRAAVSRRAKAEGWGDGSDVIEAIRRKVTEKTHGIVTGDSVKKAAAIAVAADKVALVISRHREDWEKHHATFSVELIADDFNLGKSAKISAEMLSIRQKAERIAWDLDAPEAPVSQSGVQMVLNIGGKSIDPSEFGW